MSLKRLLVTDFRCLHTAEVVFDPQFTLVSGANASGKTSLLEAIYVLGRGRSFRTRRLDNLIRFQSERFIVFGETVTDRRSRALGVEGSSRGVRAKLGGERVASLAELAVELPVQIIDPEVHRLIEEGPSRRRRFLDWGVFHVERDFVPTWQRYQQILKQRNAALRSRQSAALVGAWDCELIRHGNSVHEARARYFNRLAPVASAIAQRLLGMELILAYRSGWARDLSFGSALEASRASDTEVGATQVGPQRAEISLRLDGLPVKDRVSRGQQKLLAASLLMAQLSLFPMEAETRPTLLLDDPSAELDSDRLREMIQEVARHSVQLIVTSLTAEFSAFGAPGRRYGVREGTVSPMD